MSECDDYTDDGENDNRPVQAYIHVPGTIITLIIFCFAIQQLLGAPTNKTKVFKYRSMVAITCATALFIAVTLNFESEQDIAENEGKSSIVGKGFVKVVLTFMVIFNMEALILGYWFLIDAVAAAYKATKGINQKDPPAWIRKFWLVVIVAGESIAVLCFIFAFVLSNTFWLNLNWLVIAFISIMGSLVILVSVGSVFKSINSAIQSGRNEQTQTLQQARKTLIFMAVMGVIFVVGVVILFVLSVLSFANSADLGPCVKNINSTIMDAPWIYVRYMALINAFNLILMFWTYRSSNINYCCFCLTYKKYTSNDYKEKSIDRSVVCYRLFPKLIKSAEDKRQEMIEISESNQNPNV